MLEGKGCLSHRSDTHTLLVSEKEAIRIEWNMQKHLIMKRYREKGQKEMHSVGSRASSEGKVTADSFFSWTSLFPSFVQ